MPSMPAKQSGFTLIELMVVLVIVSVIVSVGMLSMGSSEQATLRAQERSAKALLSYVRDLSALKQRIYLVAPDEQGLSTYVLTQGRWQLDSSITPLQWQPGITLDWQIDNANFNLQPELPKAGWVFWPSGDVLAGEMSMQTAQNSQSLLDNEVSSYSFSWNGLLQFSALDGAPQ